MSHTGFPLLLPGKWAPADQAMLMRELDSPGASGVFEAWIRFVLEQMEPAVALPKIRAQVGADNDGRLVAKLALSGRLEIQDEPPEDETYDRIVNDPDLPPEDGLNRWNDYKAAHMGPPYVGPIGRLYPLLTDAEVAAAIEQHGRDKPGLILGLIQFVEKYHPTRLAPLLPAIGRYTGRFAQTLVRGLLACRTPAAQALAASLLPRITDRWDRFLALCELHQFHHGLKFSDETLAAAAAVLRASDRESNHDVVAEWLALNGGERGIALLVEFVATTNSRMLPHVVWCTLELAGTRAAPVRAAARQRGLDLPEE